MKREKILIGTALMIFFVFIISNANAISDRDLADAYYQQAKEAYDTGDCVNASEMANRALTLYIKINYEEGISKTTTLIGDINTCLKETGDELYATAMDYYNKKEYENCITFARRAKEQYSHIPDPVGMNECEKLIQDAEREIEKEKVKRADELYETAMRLYEDENLIEAPIKAKEALDIYTEINNDEGISKCNALLSAIDRRIYEIKQEAETNYRRANDHYKKATETESFDDFMKAKEYAEEAKGLFDKIGDKDGYAKSRDLITLVNGEIERLEEEFKGKADSYYNEGMTELLYCKGEQDMEKATGFCNNAKQKIEKAKSIYYQLYEWAKDIKDYKKRDEKKKFYIGKINKCDNRLKEIEDEIGRRRDIKKAEDLFVDANTFFTQGDCRNASRFADEARSLFDKANHFPGVYKCETLIYQINECLEKLKDADRYYKNATTYYEIADPDNATIMLKKARQIYEEVNNQEGIEKCNSLKEKITEMSKKKEDANLLIGEAEMYFEQNRFEDSIKAAEKAKAIYEEINYEEGVSKAKSLIEDNKEMIDIHSREAKRNMMITIGAILLAITLSIASWWIRKAQKERMERGRLESERRRLEEELRRKKEEEKRREEKRRRELEIERKKLKAMVEEEMKRLEREKRRK